MFTIEEVEKFGVESDKCEAFTRPTLEDLAIIMYTSGSTGNPKVSKYLKPEIDYIYIYIYATVYLSNCKYLINHCCKIRRKKSQQFFLMI